MDDQENVVAVIFYAMGPDPTILSLPELLRCAPYGTPRAIGDRGPDGEGKADSNYAAVTIVPNDAPVEPAIERLGQWLCDHRERLLKLDAEKTLEFQTFISPGVGSKLLYIPLEIIRLCAEVECKIAHQYSRVVTRQEYDSHRAMG